VATPKPLLMIAVEAISALSLFIHFPLSVL
jgi:hypothetical protein